MRTHRVRQRLSALLVVVVGLQLMGPCSLCTLSPLLSRAGTPASSSSKLPLVLPGFAHMVKPRASMGPGEPHGSEPAGSCRLRVQAAHTGCTPAAAEARAGGSQQRTGCGHARANGRFSLLSCAGAVVR